MSLLLLGANQFNVKQDLFSSNEQGLWLDPSDMNATKAGWRRNLLSYSEQLDNSYWSGKDRITIAADAGVSPNGTTTAESFVPTAVSGTHGIGSFSGVSMIANQAYTASFYAKASGYNFFRLRVYTGTTSLDAYFNLSNGTIGTVTAGANASIQSVGSGWYRCSVGFTAATSGSNAFVVQPLVADADNSASFTGDGTSGIFVWGAQLELGSTPSEYQRITDFSTEFKAAFPTHTLYQDSNGVTPCTAAGDPVGLILDQSRGGLGALGSELVTNGDFSSGQTGWIDSPASPIGWSFTGGALVGSNANGGYEQAVQVTSGKWYRCTITLSNLSGGAVSFAIAGAGVGPTFSSNGTNTVLINAGSTGNIGIVRRTSNFTGSIDNISVREVPGNHAYQTSSGARPTLARIPSSGRRNVLTYTEQWDNAAWTKQNSSITANATTAPNGESTADKLIASAGTAVHYASQNVSVTSGVAYTFSVYAKKADIDFCSLTGFISGAAFTVQHFNLNTGQKGTLEVINTPADTFVSSSISSVGSGWYRVTFTVTAGSSGSMSFICYAQNADNQRNWNGDGTSGIFLWGAQLETGSTATNYQKVVATTDVTESGVSDLWHLVFDGSDDSLVTNAVDFTATDEMTVIVGVRKLSDAATQMILESSANVGSNSGSFYLTAAELTGANGNFSFKTRGDVNPAAYANSGTILAPATRVISGLGDISSDVASIRINSTQTDYSADQGSGNFGNHILYIGRRNQATLPFNGHIYQLIIRGKTTPTGKLLEAERFVAKRTGVTGI